MKPRTLASIGAVLLYLWCEFFQASPFATVERERAAEQLPKSAVGATEDALREDLGTLFAPASRCRGEFDGILGPEYAANRRGVTPSP